MDKSHETFGDELPDEEKLQSESKRIENFRKLHSSNFITDTQISAQNQSIEEAIREEKRVKKEPEINSKVIYNRIKRPSNIQIIDKTDDQVLNEIPDPTSNPKGSTSKHQTLEQQDQPPTMQSGDNAK